MNPTALTDTGRRIAASGISIIPINARTKQPFSDLLPVDTDGKTTWTPFMQEIASTEWLEYWLSNTRLAAFAVVGGAVSGGLLIIDFDVERFFHAWMEHVGRLADGLPIQRTGGGGYQVALRCPAPGKNAKLAWVESSEHCTGRKIAIETRGEGGYAVWAPSRHPRGTLYQEIRGSIAEVPTVSQEIADALLNAAKELDEVPLTEQQIEAQNRASQRRASKPHSISASESVIAAFNAATDIEAILQRHGYKKGRGGMYARPGREAWRVSVTVRDGRSFHHSTNDPLNSTYWRAPFDVFLHYEHRGDLRAAVHAAAKLLGISHIQREREHHHQLRRSGRLITDFVTGGV